MRPDKHSKQIGSDPIFIVWQNLTKWHPRPRECYRDKEINTTASQARILELPFNRERIKEEFKGSTEFINLS